ncbi:T9SS type A sorting domain-containing protein [Aquimarina sp. RZ0]|uniref:T9SS type A sorting domain-containing protein n=1 Tax=Aquimarina sp. RZ0 TaxID=2607730 RepID=UPI0011F2F214|nr:T9SS type A sorting domain-containing protein [Aquimarina sp. RZ0]KAA1247259.1 T9SS type A sorting domain-containing protein [Aquimarina sp. RZ0]
MNLTIQLTEKVQSYLEIIDISGKIVAAENLGVLDIGATDISLVKYSSALTNTGLYLIKVNLGKSSIVKQLLVM